MEKKPLGKRLKRLWQRHLFRFCCAAAMVAPTISTRVFFNKLKGVKFGKKPWLGVLTFLDIHLDHPDQNNSLIIGDYVAIGPHVCIFTHDSIYNQLTGGKVPVRFGRVEIGDHVNICTNAFLCNCKIGSHSVVAPLAVVVGKEFPDYSLIAGNPAKVVKDLREYVEKETGSDRDPVRH